VTSRIAIAAARTLSKEVRSRCTVEVCASGTSAWTHPSASARASVLRAAKITYAPRRGQRPCRFPAQPGRRARDHKDLAGQVNSIDDLQGTRTFRHLGSSSLSRQSGTTTPGSHSSSTTHLHILRIGSIASCGEETATLHA